MNQIQKVIRATLCGAGFSGAALILAACATEMVVNPGAAKARADLTRLQSDPHLANNAPIAMHDAETAVQDAELPQSDPAVTAHLDFIADRRVQIAGTLAQTKYDEDQRKLLGDQNQQIQLDARTNEADSAKRKSDATQARNNDLQAQLLALQAKQTDRGMVLTLGDVLFSTGRSDLKPGSIVNLDRLVSFLGQAPDRNVQIEGYTDNRGGEDLNQALSQRRAESVASYLTGRGIASTRVTSIGNGYSSPVADNSTDAGRQANRRVEVIIQNPPL